MSASGVKEAIMAKIEITQANKDDPNSEITKVTFNSQSVAQIRDYVTGEIH